jgi:hypothetical protein
MFGSLDYIYMPAADVDGETHRYVQTLGAELVWKVRGMGTTVACLRLGEPGPAILLSGHLGAQVRSWSTGCRITPPRSRSYANETSLSGNWRYRTARAQRSRWKEGSGTRCTSSRGPVRFTISMAVSTHSGECAAVLRWPGRILPSQRASPIVLPGALLARPRRMRIARS